MTADDYKSQKRKRSRHEYYLRRREAALAYQKKYDAEHRELRKAYLRAYKERKKKEPAAEE